MIWEHLLIEVSKTMEILRITSLIILILFIIVLIACYATNTKDKDRTFILILTIMFAIPTIYIILN